MVERESGISRLDGGARRILGITRARTILLYVRSSFILDLDLLPPAYSLYLRKSW
jgi:hypothetical protein